MVGMGIMNQSIKMIITLVLVGFLLLGCAKKDEAPDNLKINEDVTFEEDDYEKIIPAQNALGFKMLHQAEESEENVLISPTSLFIAISIIYNGAANITKEEISQALQTDGLDVEEINEANASLLMKLKQDSDDIELNIANSIWLNENFSFKEKFQNQAGDYFNAEVSEVDITKDRTSSEINKWVEEATNGNLTDIVEPPIDPEMFTFILNAIYFKGAWTYPFDPEETRDGEFQLVNGNTSTVPFMTLEKELPYIDNKSFQAVKLPYGEGDMSMHIFLPNEDLEEDEFATLFSIENWKKWNEEYELREGTLTLPKFQVEDESVFNKQLQQLGMGTSFDEDADFSKMIEEDKSVYLSQIKQKTFLDVSEQGTEAASSTSAEMEVTSLPVDEPFQMEADRPFYIALTDNDSDAILFLGSIVHPEQAE